MSIGRELTERGYTLMEIVVAAVPLALIGLSLFSAFSFTVAFSRRGEGNVEAVREARMALHYLAQELREAGATPGAIVVWSREEGDSVDGVGFLTARVDGPGRPFVTDPYGTPRWQQAVYYVHDRARGELRRITDESTTLTVPASRARGRVEARQVRRLRVERQGNLVRIIVTVGRTSGEAVLDMAVRPRN